MFDLSVKCHRVYCWSVVPGIESTALLIEANTPSLGSAPVPYFLHLNLRQRFLKLPQIHCFPASASLQLGLQVCAATPDSDFVH